MIQSRRAFALDCYAIGKLITKEEKYKLLDKPVIWNVTNTVRWSTHLGDGQHHCLLHLLPEERLGRQRVGKIQYRYFLTAHLEGLEKRLNEETVLRIREIWNS